MARLRLPSSGLTTPTATRDRSSRRTQSDSEPGEVRGSQLSSLERSSNHQEEDGHGSEDRPGPRSNNSQVEAEVENTEMREFSNGGEVI